jgi:hypothetical protein
MLLELHPEALEELEAAVVWHNRERAGRGDLLYDEVRRRVAQATRLPRSGAPVVGFDARYDGRSYSLQRFRYRVITAVVIGAPLVVAVAHTRREPTYWRERLGAGDE